jgi:hypothetical protein
VLLRFSLIFANDGLPRLLVPSFRTLSTQSPPQPIHTPVSEWLYQTGKNAAGQKAG